VVARRRLTSLLDLARHQRLTMVVAPPGYGKTVLLTQWANGRGRHRVRWLAITEADNDAPTFARHLRAAVRDVDDELVLDELSAAQKDGMAPTGRPSLSFVPPTTLIVDDFQRLTDPAVLDEFATVIEHAPVSMHVIIASRIDPPLPYYRLSLADAVVELRQDDLAFTNEEASRMLARLAECELEPGQVEMLVERAEGWAVGLQLAAISLRRGIDADAFIETFAGDDRHVADYLTEEVLRHEPEDVRRFLLSTSVLHSMNGALCDAVTEGLGSESMLLDLQRRSMFVVPADGRRDWFRYHELFRTLLRQHLHDQDPDRERRLLQRAGRWHVDHDEVTTGVRYFAEARAWPDVLATVEDRGGDHVSRGEAAVVAAWLDMIPTATRRRTARACLLDAAAHALSGDAVPARRTLDLGLSATWSKGDWLVARLVQSYALLQHGDITEARHLATSVLDDVDMVDESEIPHVLGLTNDRTDVAVAARVIAAVALMYEGEWRQAREAFDPLPETCHAVWQITALGAHALLEAWSGRLSLAQRLGAWSLAMAREFGLHEQSIGAEPLMALAVVARERRDLVTARILLDQARRSGAGRRRLLTTVIATEQALIAHAEVQPAAGLAALNALRREETTGSAALTSRQRAVEAQLHVLAGDLDLAERAVELAPRRTHDVVAALAEIAVERGDLDQVRLLLTDWPHTPSPRAELERLLWAAIVEHLAGDDLSARASMMRVVAEAETERAVGLFRSRHALIPLRALYRDTPSPLLREIVEQPSSTPQARPVKELIEQLTEREYEVLSLLPTRLSNVEMADTLDVSLNTVKTHLKHIYRKLCVADRSEAIATAERLRLW
jgi:LuxR family transcriptional regulator, maltose regulon positive regulatory protein